MRSVRTDARSESVSIYVLVFVAQNRHHLRSLITLGCHKIAGQTHISS